MDFLGRKLKFFVFAALFPAGCVCTRASDLAAIDKFTKTFKLDSSRSKDTLDFFTQEPHPFGSSRQGDVADFLAKSAREFSSSVWQQEFNAETPIRTTGGDQGPRALTERKRGINVLASFGLKKDAPCVVLLGSHYDTKILDGFDYLGANDSGSSSVVLLELLRFARESNIKLDLKCDLMAVWFDGEESILDGWWDAEKSPLKIKDHTYGSRFFAESLDANTKRLPEEYGGAAVVALVLLDMVGSPNLVFTRERNSSTYLLKLLEATLTRMGKADRLTSFARDVADDHIEFLSRDIPSLNLIDFEHLQTWHKPGDVANTLSPESMQLAGIVGLNIALQIASTPKGKPD